MTNLQNDQNCWTRCMSEMDIKLNKRMVTIDQNLELHMFSDVCNEAYRCCAQSAKRER